MDRILEFVPYILTDDFWPRGGQGDLPNLTKNHRLFVALVMATVAVGFDGLHASTNYIALKLDMSPRTVREARRRAERHKLIQTCPHFDGTEGPGKTQEANTYVLGRVGLAIFTPVKARIDERRRERGELRAELEMERAARGVERAARAPTKHAKGRAVKRPTPSLYGRQKLPPNVDQKNRTPLRPPNRSSTPPPPPTSSPPLADSPHLPAPNHPSTLIADITDPDLRSHLASLSLFDRMWTKTETESAP